MLSTPSVKNNLSFIKTYFSRIPFVIKNLEAQGLQLSESLDLLESIRDNLASLDDKQFLLKFEKVMKRNKGFESLHIICNIIFKNSTSSNEYTNKLSPLELSFFKYCPVTSADVERSFSSYNNLLTENRRSFCFESIKKHMIVYCNNFFTE